MAYFSNGTDGEVFDNECQGCKYGYSEDGNVNCPIQYVQLVYNYDACNNKIATKILNDLVKNDGTCEMKKAFSKDFKTDAHNLKLNF